MLKIRIASYAGVSMQSLVVEMISSETGKAYGHTFILGHPERKLGEHWYWVLPDRSTKTTNNTLWEYNL